MTKRQYRNYSVFFFFMLLINIGFLINTFLKPFSFWNLIMMTLFGILIYQLLGVTLLMYRKSKELDLK